MFNSGLFSFSTEVWIINLPGTEVSISENRQTLFHETFLQERQDSSYSAGTQRTRLQCLKLSPLHNFWNCISHVSTTTLITWLYGIQCFKAAACQLQAVRQMGKKRENSILRKRNIIKVKIILQKLSDPKQIIYTDKHDTM